MNRFCLNHDCKFTDLIKTSRLLCPSTSVISGRNLCGAQSVDLPQISPLYSKILAYPRRPISTKSRDESVQRFGLPTLEFTRIRVWCPASPHNASSSPIALPRLAEMAPRREKNAELDKMPAREVLAWGKDGILNGLGTVF